jgi:probable HAF family extracellular repeat protein
MTADERARCGDEPGITRKGASSAVYLLGVSVPGREGAPASQRRRRHAGRFGHRRQLPRSSLPTVVVGFSNDASGHGFKAFRWTAASGMVGLGFLPGGNQSSARGVNADGKVVVGQANDASDQPQAFRWTRATRMQSVLTLLLAAKVVTMTGWQLRSANGVSADGTVIVGDGVDPLGQSQAWIARLPKEDNEDCEEDDDNQGDNDNQGGDFGQ